MNNNAMKCVVLLYSFSCILAAVEANAMHNKNKNKILTFIKFCDEEIEETPRQIRMHSLPKGDKRVF